MATLVENFQSGTISDNPLTDVATSVTSTAFASLPVVSAPDVMKLVLDPEGVAGDPEIVTVTAHTSSSTSVTVTRGSNNRQHLISTKWVMAATKAEWDSVLAAVNYVPPVGSMMPYAGTSSPDTNVWLLCDGAAVSRTTYASLFSLTGTTFGGGDGSTTFNVPDMRGRVPMGMDDYGSGAAGVVTDAAADTLGGELGTETHLLTSAEMPAHVHDIGHADTIATANEGAHTHTINHGHADTIAISSSGAHQHTSDFNGYLSWDSALGGTWDMGGSSVQNMAGSHVTSTGSAHTHTVTGGVTSHSGSSGTGTNHSHSITGGVTDMAGNSGSIGSDTAHTSMQPVLALGYLIRAA
jgi:microcystin-dependent protein